jgi:CHASE3 domain sensor protein
MRHRIASLVAAAALLGAAGCGSDDGADEQAATTTTPAADQATTTTGATSPTTTETGERGGRLSPEGRAVLAATQDLAADVSETAEDFARGRIDEQEARAQMELARERADTLRRRAQQLPEADGAGQRLATLNEEITRTAAEISRLVSSDRAQSRDEIDERIAELRDDARSTFDALRRQLDEPTQRRLREALDRIAPGAG